MRSSWSRLLLVPLGLGALWLLASCQLPAAREGFPEGYFEGDPLPDHTVYLTFDDGPGEFTAQVLDTLKAEGVKASFFINSYDRLTPRGVEPDPAKNWLLQWSGILARMIKEGHLLASHNFTHRDLAGMSAAKLAFELATLESHLKAALPSELQSSLPLRYLRPPYGSPWYGNWNSLAERQKVLDAVKDRYTVVLWTKTWDSGDSLDWVEGEWWQSASPLYHPGTKAWTAKVERRIQSKILNQADTGAGGVVLLHDIHPTTVTALPALIRLLKSRGYHLETLDSYFLWRQSQTPKKS